MNHLYLFGHRHPDTDSIASVIGYAEFKNRSEPGRYIPARCGELNPESGTCSNGSAFPNRCSYLQ